MLISVSIPVYNAEAHIDRCIQSIVNQTWNDYELIIVNDGSKDNSLSKIKTWEKRYPDIIRVIDSENKGSLLARRRCIEESRGSFLYIIDADDYLIRKDALEIIANTIIKEKCDLVFFNATKNENMEKMFSFPFFDGELFECQNLSKVHNILVEGNNLNQLWNKVFSRELIDHDCNYEQYSYVRNGTDSFQVIPIILNAKRIIYLDSILYYYQYENNSNSIVHKFNDGVFLSLKSIIERLEQELKKRDLLSSEYVKMINRRYVSIACTSANKIKQTNSTRENRVKWFRTIGEDLEFRERFRAESDGKLSFSKRVIALLLYYRLYYFLALIIK